MPLEYDDEPGSWGRMSEGWPSTSERAMDKYVFLNKLTHPPVPYGSYVIVGKTLRVENKRLLNNLERTFKAAGEPTQKQIMKRYDAAVKATQGSSSWPTLDKWW